MSDADSDGVRTDDHRVGDREETSEPIERARRALGHRLAAAAAAD